MRTSILGFHDRRPRGNNDGGSTFLGEGRTLTLWHVYLKAYQYRFNIVSTRSLLTLYNGHAIGNPYRKEFAGENRFMTIGLNAGRCE